MKQKINAILLVLVGLFLTINLTLAAEPPRTGLVQCVNNCQLKDLVYTVVRLINFLIAFAGLIAFVFLVWAGWQFINAAGNEEKIATAKASLSDAIIGFFLVLITFVLLNAILGILGIYDISQLFGFITK